MVALIYELTDSCLAKTKSLPGTDVSPHWKFYTLVHMEQCCIELDIYRDMFTMVCTL
jgi:hypothetical protein